VPTRRGRSGVCWGDRPARTCQDLLCAGRNDLSELVECAGRNDLSELVE
jgi:hypothetical protein